MKKNRTVRRIRNRLLCWIVLALIAAGRFLPRKVMLSVLGRTGEAFYHIPGKSRKITLENLRLAFPGLPDAEIGRLAKKVFRDMGRNIVDVLRIPSMTGAGLDKIVKLRGKEFLDTALAKKKGVVVITGHIGSWELMASYISRKGYKLNVLVRTAYDPGLEKILGMVRESAGVAQIPRDGALREIFRALRKGEIVGILLDQDTKVEGTFVEFMGRSAYTPVGAVRIAMKTGAPVIPMAIRMDDSDNHIIEIDSEVELVRSGNYAEDVRVNTQKCTGRIEKFIGEAPTQWVWMHERWKTRPA